MKMNDFILEALEERLKLLLEAQSGLRKDGIYAMADNLQMEIDQIEEEIALLKSGEAPDLGVFNPDGP